MAAPPDDAASDGTRAGLATNGGSAAAVKEPGRPAADATVADGVPALPADTIGTSRGSRPTAADADRKTPPSKAKQSSVDDSPAFSFEAPPSASARSATAAADPAESAAKPSGDDAWPAAPSRTAPLGTARAALRVPRLLSARHRASRRRRPNRRPSPRPRSRGRRPTRRPPRRRPRRGSSCGQARPSRAPPRPRRPRPPTRVRPPWAGPGHDAEHAAEEAVEALGTAGPPDHRPGRALVGDEVQLRGVPGRLRHLVRRGQRDLRHPVGARRVRLAPARRAERHVEPGLGGREREGGSPRPGCSATRPCSARSTSC